VEESDESLLEKWLHGESRAFERFYLRHSGRVAGYARKKGVPSNEVSEVVQECFLKLHLHISQYRPEKHALPWFFTIVHNTCVDTLKRGGKSKKEWSTVSLEKIENMIASQSEKRDPVSQFDSDVLLARLNVGQKSILDMRLHEELSFEEMAISTGKSAVSLRKSYSRTIQLLRDWIKMEKKS
jgi:RNA polymerase sigma-70 factor, ECF subfamily